MGDVGNLLSIHLATILLTDELFDVFCRFFKECRSVCDNPNQLQQLEDSWGMWLCCEEDKLDEWRKEAEQMTEVDRNKSWARLKNAKNYGSAASFENPCYVIRCGLDMLAKGALDNAAELFSQAIAMDEAFAHVAYYNRARARIQLGFAQPTVHNLPGAIDDLFRAFALVEKVVLPTLDRLESCATLRPGSELQRQLEAKRSLAQLQLRSIEQLLQELQKLGDGFVIK
ncbi:hypothetical protein AAVH_37885, partial [Aphelenchoides avenae]